MGHVLTTDEITEALQSLPGWSGDPAAISRTAELSSFPAAIGVVDRVAAVADEMDHHPDMDIRWRKVTFSCATHSAGGVTAKDLDLARRINEIVAATD